jgi:hypothetical protein
MADIDMRLILDVEVKLTLDAAEASALGALAGYGTDEFLKCFYKNMGAAYLKPHEHGLRRLFAKVRGVDSRTAESIGNVRQAIAEFHKKERDRKSAKEAS